jgi:hypothetical protein
VIFVFIFVCTIASALFHLHMTRAIPHTRARVVEVFLLFFLCGQWGFGAIATALPHILVPDTIAGFIGWEAGSPFQVELGFASLGLGVLGVLSIWLRGTFWIAPAVGRSIFLLGAAYVHIVDIARTGNLAPGNAGPVLFFDIVVPVIVLWLLWAHARNGGLETEEAAGGRSRLRR